MKWIGCLHAATVFALSPAVALTPTGVRRSQRKAAKNHSPASVRIYMEPGCEHCQAYLIGPLKSALANEDVASNIDLDINPVGNAYFEIPECAKAAQTDAEIGCSGSGGYDVGRRTCYYQKCGLGSAPAERAADCFAGPLVVQFGFLQMYATRYLLCAKRDSRNATVPWRKYAPFYICMEENFDDIHDGASTSLVAKKCAKSAGLHYHSLESCYNSEEIEQLYHEEASATPDHPGVPWIVLNDVALEETYENDALVNSVLSVTNVASSALLLSQSHQAYKSGNDVPDHLESLMRRNITC